MTFEGCCNTWDAAVLHGPGDGGYDEGCASTNYDACFTSYNNELSTIHVYDPCNPAAIYLVSQRDDSFS